MSTFPSSPQKPARFDLYAGKFRGICEMHGIKTGSRDDLEGFLATLSGDKHFGMDFWGLIGKVSDRGGGELSDEQILALVVEGVTGRAMSADDPGMKPLFTELRALLAGEDVRREPLSFPAPPRATSVASIEEARPRRFSASLPLMPQPAEGEPVPAVPLPSQPQMQLAIQNLEIVSRELKERLEKSEERLARLEARARRPNQPQPIEPILNEGRQPEQKSADKPRLVLDPVESAVAHSSPLFEAYSPERDYRWRKRVSLALLFLTIAAGGLALQRYYGKIRQVISAIVEEDLKTPAPPPLPAKAKAPPSSVLPIQESASASPDRSSMEGISRPPAENRSPEAASPRSTLPDRAAAQNREDTATLSSAVPVSGVEMEKYLILSRVPVYPEAAKEEGIEGAVVAEVLISKYGTVTRVLVIGGDSRLRNAAAEAIYKRRYRPYQVHGQSVDVATTVTINFKLDG
jgi:TonB family protein